MTLLLLVIEFASCCAVVSASAWLRHLSGVRETSPYLGGARYFLPFTAALFFFIAVVMAIHWMEGYRPASPEPSWNWVLGGGVLLAVLLVQLILAVRRYRAHPHDAHRVTRSRSRLW